MERPRIVALSADYYNKVVKVVNDCINDLETLCSKDDIQSVGRKDLEESVVDIYERLVSIRLN